MSLENGTRLGPYEVVQRIGSGGMGEVYRAKDVRLGRQVAIKVLREEFSDRAGLRRFEREARAASALNHPNIVTIYDIGTHGTSRFIAMELVEGETLRKILDAGRLSTDRLMLLATQIVDGLAKAHKAGIVHRDLKPENLIVTGDGLVKIVDFGLAKLAPASAPTDSGQISMTADPLTGSGDIVGTVGYMSPEQASGRPVSFRSDQFAFGLILYEMMTGQQAFWGETAPQLVAAIIESEPQPPDNLNSDVPSELHLVVRRSLAKDPADRYESTADLAKDLKTIRSASVRKHRRDERAAIFRYWRLVLVSAVFLAGALTYRFYPKRQSVPRLRNPVQITGAVGVEDYPTWSSDGAMLAYHSNQSGSWDIWVTQSSGGQPLNRTADHPEDDRFPSWSPDGRQIAFLSERGGGGYFVMSPLAGVPNKVVAVTTGQFYGSPPQWSADGTLLACVVEDTEGRFVEIVSPGSGDSRRLPLPGQSLARFDLSWSPDDRYFAYVDAHALNSHVTRLMVLRVADGDAFAVSDGFANDRSPSWSSDGRSLFFLSDRGGSMDLWRQRIREDGAPEGAPEPITTGIGIRHAEFSPDGAKLAYSKGRRVSNVWRVPILPDRPAEWADARQVTFEQAFIEHVDVSSDGQRLLLSSDRRGNPDLWMMNADGTDIRQITSDPAPDWAPKWSPDGTEIAFYAHRGGNRDIWIKPLDGGPARQVTQNPGQDLEPAWSPDGSEIAFFSDRSGNWDIWVIPTLEGEARQLTTDTAVDYFSQWSPDGKSLAFHSDRSGNSRLWRVDARGGDAELLTQGPGMIPRWSSDGRYIYFNGLEERTGNVWELSVEEGFERPVTDLVGRPGSLGSDSLDLHREQIYFIWEEDLSDLWVMDATGSSLR